MPQSYESHAHHPIATYVAGGLWLAAFICLVGWAWFGWTTLAAGAILLALCVAPLVAISRWYVVRLQDRIIRLEMKVRCAEVLPAGEDALLDDLTVKQIVALRFASDEELGPLLARASREKLAPDVIKRSIRTWRPDDLRT
jgi:hypothetical protein